MQTCTLRDLVAEGTAAATETDPDAAGSSAAHNEVRDQVREQLLTILTDKHDGDVPTAVLRRSLLQDEELLTAFNRAWPLLDAARQRLGDPDAARRRRRHSGDIEVGTFPPDVPRPVADPGAVEGHLAAGRTVLDVHPTLAPPGVRLSRRRPRQRAKRHFSLAGSAGGCSG